MQIPTLQQLLEAGVHFGHKVSRGNPRMKPYIYGARDGVSIIDLTLSEKGLKAAVEYVMDLGKSGGVLLFVGTKKQAQDIVREQAQKLGAPYLTHRWIGGFLTNFDEVSKNIKRLKEINEQKEKGELSKYTKKEQLLIDRRRQQLERDLGGAKELEKLPDAIFLVDAAKEDTAIREAARVGVKIVAIADTNCDPTLIDYPIPGNDDAIKSIKIMVEVIAEAYGEGKKEANTPEVKSKVRSKPDTSEVEKVEVIVPEEEVAAAEEILEKKEVEESERKV